MWGWGGGREMAGELSRERQGWGWPALCLRCMTLQEAKSWVLGGYVEWQVCATASCSIPAPVGPEHRSRCSRDRNSHVLPLGCVFVSPPWTVTAPLVSKPGLVLASHSTEQNTEAQ